MALSIDIATSMLLQKNFHDHFLFKPQSFPTQKFCRIAMW